MPAVCGGHPSFFCHTRSAWRISIFLPSSPQVVELAPAVIGRGGDPSVQIQDRFPIKDVGNDAHGDGNGFPIKNVGNDTHGGRFPFPAFTLARGSALQRVNAGTSFTGTTGGSSSIFKL